MQNALLKLQVDEREQSNQIIVKCFFKRRKRVDWNYWTEQKNEVKVERVTVLWGSPSRIPSHVVVLHVVVLSWKDKHLKYNILSSSCIMYLFQLHGVVDGCMIERKLATEIVKQSSSHRIFFPLKLLFSCKNKLQFKWCQIPLKNQRAQQRINPIA